MASNPTQKYGSVAFIRKVFHRKIFQVQNYSSSIQYWPDSCEGIILRLSKDDELPVFNKKSGPVTYSEFFKALHDSKLDQKRPGYLSEGSGSPI
jgi:hypothetical protein